MKPRNRWLSAYAVVVYVFLFAPIVVLNLFSFNSSRANFQWEGFTLDWYPTLFKNRRLLDAVSVTLRVALVAVVVSTVIGTLLGLALARVRFRGRAAAETLLLVPMVTPEIIMGLSLLVFFFAAFGGRGSFGQLALAHITFCISYVAIVVRARAAGMNPQLEEAARDLGASAFGAFRYITLPLILPFIFIAAMIRLIDALKSFDIIFAITQGGPGSASETVNLYLYSVAFVYYDIGYGSAIALIFFVIIVMLAAVMLYVRQRMHWAEAGGGA